ncbi:MAG: protein kinase, partial [Gammaproteobacteria bacterium]|nr:protein kinase [Gemmatimonadota bacterium]NIR38476.1 protein kinase [Actinomycetota bacterium]NIU76485.1 protein kinase [Gammaproteobacteria bacterium]
HYMAPEQITGGKITPSTDLFAVGTVAYELLSNAKPFTGETLHSVLFKVVDEEPPPLDQLVPGLPVKLRDIVAKAMAKKPAQRYHSATEMDREVTAVRAEISEGTAGPTVIRRTPLQTLPPTAAIRRRRRRWILSTATLIVAVGATGWFLGPWRGEGRSFVTTAG